MKLENIINIFNTTQGTTFIPVRKSESVSSFSPGVKKQSISLMSREFKDSIITFEEVSLLDITEQLEDLVLEFLFNYSKNPTKIDEWINAAQKYDIPELQTFINGIKKDITAVKNGIIYSYNNGLAEGSVNKIKVIKRVMYGRNSFELLKAKVLFGELYHVKFN